MGCGTSSQTDKNKQQNVLEPQSNNVQDQRAPPAPLPKKQNQNQISQQNDLDFPAKLGSLAKDHKLMPNAKNYEWKRSKEIFDIKKLNIFQQQIQPDNIVQGKLGNNYFLSALSCLAERPHLIEKLFITKQINEQGIYAVYLNIDGIFQEVIIDDFFPCSQEKPVFSYSNSQKNQELGEELWVLILEKAYAKCYGSYQQIISGKIGHAITDLTGAPSKQISTQVGAEKIWNFIVSNADEGYVLSADPNRNEQLKQGQNIDIGYSFAILNYQIVKFQGNQEKIIQIRNPWGSYQWQGDWSNKSQKWDQQSKKQCNLNENDGKFWININDFVKEFKAVTVNYLVEDYLYTSYQISLKKTNMSLVRFNVKYDNTHIFIGIQQKDERHFLPNTYKYSLLKLILVKEDTESYIDDTMTNERNLYIEKNLQSGAYLAYIDIQWQNLRGDAENVVFNIYSSDQVQIQQQNIEVFEDNMEIVDRMIMGKQQPDQSKIKYYDDNKKICRYTISFAGYLSFIFDNQSENNQLIESVSLQMIQNLKICKPFTNNEKFEVIVNPGEKKIVKYKITSPSGSDYNYKAGYAGGIQMSDQEIIAFLQSQEGLKYRKVREGEVYYYTYPHQSGFALMHWNQTQKKYDEELELNLKNLCVQGMEGQSKPTLNIVLGPGEWKLTKLNIIDRTKEFSFKTSVSFLLE
ncbi:hypothetical protein PPERSA_09850 [Pseudocohnilembus persalinus]|uniref:Calpain catalytic domain-containing protein n=1 Tax=Pseudocohnilembus persalinus TaxID=266149 RepID=A0A0V0QTX4_PSEPJ|nr:hypothetical protein PPERSA_09850 [Pseudocohnilembus persalinus]|eukprot:KRX05710.1 hypothetical protein PPERSA_09850 [Pseudocohnilembus persalinus]